MLRSLRGEARLLQDASPHLLWTTDAHGRTLWANRTWHSHTGHDGPAGTGLGDLVHPDQLPEVLARLAAPDAPAFHLDVQLRRADGTFSWFRLHGQTLPDDPPHGGAWLLTATDIGDLVRERRERATLQSVIDASPSCVKVLDLQGRLLSMNEGGRDIMEIDDFELCRSHLWPEFWQGEARALVEDALARGRAGQRTTFEAATATMKGTLKWWEVSVSPLRDGQGRVHQLCAISRDMTERKTAQDTVIALNAELEHEVERRTRQLEEERAALDAFVAFSELVGTETDEIRLAGQAVDVLQVRFADSSGGYFQREGGCWKLRTWTSDLDERPSFLAGLRAGLSPELPIVADLLRTRAPTFTEDWSAEEQGIKESEVYGANAAYPVVLGGEVRGFFTLSLKARTRWTERDRAIFRAVGRGLDLALERAALAARQERQTAELDARTRALEGFADLTRDLSLEANPYVLVRRAQEVALSLLPPGYALYFEPEGERWVLHGQTGDLRSAALQAVADAGLPYHEANNLLIPHTSQAPYYQDQYAQDTDQLDDLVAHLGASATLPVLVNGRARGVFAVVLFGGTRQWARPDQAALESVVRSLGLALERAAQAREITAWRERYEVAVRGSGHLLYDWDPATGAVVYGGAVEDITGYAPGELDGTLGDWTGRLVHPDDREAFAREIARVLASGENAHLAFRLVRKDGSVREVEDDGYTRRGPQGQVTRMAGFVKDVTERKRAEAELRRSNEELRQSNADLEQFAYVASHDLQAPIRAVTSFAEIIDRRYGEALDDRGRLYLRQIVESGEHMKRLVDDLLTFSRVQTEQRPPHPTDAGAVVDAVLRRLQPEIEALGAGVTRGKLPRVLADAQQLDQLLQNLLTNALKYRREGLAPHIHIGAKRVGRLWRLAVSDNGIGIEPQYHERIFVIFQRLHGRQMYAGTGIGLAVCKKIVERHGGRLWLDSTPGEGSTFFFTLPEA